LKTRKTREKQKDRKKMETSETKYCVIINDPETGAERVATRGPDGRPMTTATAAEALIEAYRALFPGYEYRWAPTRWPL